MNTYNPDENKLSTAFNGKMLSCPLKKSWLSFQLVDEFGEGIPYTGLEYTLKDSADQVYVGLLDSQGFAKVYDCHQGPVILTLNIEYKGGEIRYEELLDRKHYPLPITELQVRAEKTQFFHKDGFRTEHNPANKNDGNFIQVEVRDLVKNGAHLPPVVDRHYPPKKALLDAVAQLSPGQDASDLYGVGLMPKETLKKTF
ncbi:hypothetical protein HBN82_06980 [Pseudomonas lundensis]|uniref:hypothetical protein n=1 Tax=Pseudomonas lundensis TaxID=86185 RepID=UPI001473841E|nr:hypothetical protein [Pseudomonas lundensis]NNA15612.1 hypothetical protein [Pseudomonas lundensis]